VDQAQEAIQLENLIAAHVSRHSVCFTHELETGPVAAGSGTLVRCGSTFGVVTCAHVLWGLTKDASREPTRRVAIGIPAVTHDRIQSITMTPGDFAQLPMVRLGKETTGGEWGSDGPDLGFVLLPPSTASTLAAIGSVLDLNAQAALAGSPWPLHVRGMHMLVGVAESNIGAAVPKYGQPVFPVMTEVIPLVIEALEEVGGYDRRLMSPEGRFSYPPSYAGMSGGGVWTVAFGQQDGQYNVQDRRLTGVAYYQCDSGSTGARQLIGHGPKSIYEKLLPEIRALIARSA
jgi:hypothetical protein